MSYNRATVYFGAPCAACTREGARAGSLQRHVRELRDRRLLLCGMVDTRRGVSPSVKPLMFVQKFLPCLRTRTGADYGNMRSSFFLAMMRRGVIVGLARLWSDPTIRCHYRSYILAVGVDHPLTLSDVSAQVSDHVGHCCGWRLIKPHDVV